MLKSKTTTNTLYKNQTFSIWNKLKGHYDTILQPDAYDLNTKLADTSFINYTDARHLQAYLTKNAFDMSFLNEYELWPHTNFGTIDNPNLVFGANTTWRMVVCSGMGSEEESSSHEKMYFIVREGPIHRCMFCGQCFKLVKLKDGYTRENSYYSSVFTEINSDNVGLMEYFPTYTFPWIMQDFDQGHENIMPENRNFVFVNPDQRDRILVDPAYRMSFNKEMEIQDQKRLMVVDELERQSRLADINVAKQLLPKDTFETWYQIEKQILKYDRMYNRYEKFAGRKLFDADNHDRREERMLKRKQEREVSNYTYYFGGLTEQEQMFRDYYESDLEEFTDSEIQSEMKDIARIRSTGDFDEEKYEFIDGTTKSRIDYRIPVESFLEKILFKHRYRKVSDKHYIRREERVANRFDERSKTRNPEVIQDLAEKLENVHMLNDNKNELLPFAEYVAEEGYQQFMDYYESDLESGEINKEMLEDLNNRDRLLFTECYENFMNEALVLDKYYVSIPKRKYDENKSIVANFFDDLVDFNYRVKPLGRNLSFKDAVSKYQVLPSTEEEAQVYNKDNERFRKVLDFTKSGKTYVDSINNNKNI